MSHGRMMSTTCLF